MTTGRGKAPADMAVSHWKKETDMGSTWESLLNALIECRNRDYRSEPERAEAMLSALDNIVQTMLEKLSDDEEQLL
jgi:hypothetical protein